MLIDGSKKCNCSNDLNFRFCMLLNSAVNSFSCFGTPCINIVLNKNEEYKIK